MSDAIEHINLDSDDYADAPRALREYAQKLKRELQKTAEDRDTLRGQLQGTALKDVLTGFKNPQRVQSALLADKVDPLNSEAVTSWLQDNGDDYAKVTGEPGQPNGEEQQQQQPARQSLADQYAAMRSLDGSVRADADLTKVDAVKEQITADMRGEDVIRLINENGL